MLEGRRILIGVCGSIAAYKSAFLVRLLIKAGAEVRVVMTSSAVRFIGPLTFRTLTSYPVFTDLWTDEEGMNLKSPHIHLAEWAEIFLIAPCTADTLARLASGRAENALDAVFLSARCPVVLAPAMDVEMYHHPAVAHNRTLLTQKGVAVLDTDSGELASGLQGAGRMLEPEELFDELVSRLGISPFWKNQSVLITAGPTREKLDPVRYLSNFSTGKMGYALAEAARKAGATVTLISGPVHLPPPAGVTLISIESAAEMWNACMQEAPRHQFIFMTAAVADYAPASIEPDKIKKQEEALSIPLAKTKDILLELGKRKSPNQKLIGFALETRDEESYARQKLEKKNLDMVVLNSLRTPGAGFGTDTNQVTVFFRDSGRQPVYDSLKTKQEVARTLLDLAQSLA